MLPDIQQAVKCNVCGVPCCNFQPTLPMFFFSPRKKPWKRNFSELYVAEIALLVSETWQTAVFCCNR